MIYGKYRAIVTDVNDLTKLGKVKVQCKELFGTNEYWASPCFNPNEIRIPQKGDLVWIEFEGGVQTKPVWTGVFYTKEKLVEMMGGTYKPSLVLLTSKGEMQIKTTGAMQISTDGDMKIHNKTKLEVNNIVGTGESYFGTTNSKNVKTENVNATVDIKLNGTKVAINGDSVSTGGVIIVSR